MLCINVNSVSEGLHKALSQLRHGGLRADSRNGEVVVMPYPVTTTYLKPLNRVLLAPTRDANPFFHVMEALWMLAGRNDLAWPKLFNQRFKEYSDDGSSIHGAYGHRWRNHFAVDQLSAVITELRSNPQSRRAVVSMWDPDVDLGGSGVDLPCNTHAYFSISRGALDMTVCCRSNDVWWGCYGANAVHFSFLLEYMAAMIAVPVGVYRQMSNNFHIYTGVAPIGDMAWLEKVQSELSATDPFTRALSPYARTEAVWEGRRVPLVAPLHKHAFEEELSSFMYDPLRARSYSNPFFGLVAAPMYKAWIAHKHKDYGEALVHAEDIRDEAWHIACREWLQRRKLAAHNKARKDG